MDIEKAKKEKTSSDEWLYEVFAHRGNKKYRFLRDDRYTAWLKPSDIVISKKHKIGFIEYKHIFAYDLEKKRLLWIKDFNVLKTDVEVKMRDCQLDEENRRIIFKFKSREYPGKIFGEDVNNRLLEIDFDGNIITQAYPDIHKLLSREIKLKEISIKPEVITIESDFAQKVFIENHGNYKKYKSKRKLEDIALQYYRSQGLEGFHFDGGVSYTINSAFKQKLTGIQLGNKFEDFGDGLTSSKARTAMKIFAKCLKNEKLDIFRKLMFIGGGSPDLFVYKKDYSDFFFIEVKGKNDALSAKQKFFFSYAMATQMAKVKLAYVKFERENFQCPQKITWNINSVLSDMEKQEKKVWFLWGEHLDKWEWADSRGFEEKMLDMRYNYDYQEKERLKKEYRKQRKLASQQHKRQA